MLARSFANRTSALVVAAACLCAVNGHAADRQRVTELGPLLVTAIDRGTAHGVLVGSGAEYVAQIFRSTAPIEIDVRTVSALREAGCKRLAVTTTQDQVVDFNRAEKAASPQRLTFTYEMNYCRDGRVPEGAQR